MNKSDGEISPKRKRNANDEEGEISNSESGGTAAVAIVPSQQQTGDIFKLDIDCFEEAFDFLELKDLVSVGKTCKRLQQVAGYCFQQNYSTIFKSCDENGVHTRWYGLSRINLDCFIPFITHIYFDKYSSFRVFRIKQSKFVRLKQMTFSITAITSHETECVKNKLKNLDYLRVVGGYTVENLYEMLLKFCINLKRLILQYVDENTDWMLKNYPKMEHLEYLPCQSYHPCDEIYELITFFELNPTLRMFSTFASFLFYNRATMMSGKVKLDDLAVFVDHHIESKFHELVEYLIELHAQGVYERLHLYLPSATQDMVDKTVQFQSLITLYIGHIGYGDKITLPILKSLQEICIYPSDIYNLEDVASKFPNLKRVYLRRDTSTGLLMFISRTVNSVKIEIDDLEEGIHFNEDDDVLDLVALNKERQQLNEAEKCTIYVNEEVYLSTKWAMKGNDFSHIVMRRADSCVWDHSFIGLCK